MSGLSPRSIVASALLGCQPPRLPGPLLVAFAQQFGIRPGTTRTALSRMVQRRELQRNPDGSYELVGAMLDRYRAQQARLASVATAWDGRWEIRVVPAGRRTAAQRSSMRQLFTRLSLWERRDGVWIRPANLNPERLPEVRSVADTQSDAFVAYLDGDPNELINGLVDLDSWAQQSRLLIAELEQAGPRPGHSGFPAESFVRVVSAFRHLLSDPLLPQELAPIGWPATALRHVYDQHLSMVQHELQAFFRAELDARTLRPDVVTGSTVGS